MRENVSTEPLACFLAQMHHYVHRHVIVVWDRVPVHGSVAKWFQANHPTWFTFESLPSYAPELNPVEECWEHTKYTDLVNYAPKDIDDLELRAAKSMTNQRNNQPLLKSHFRYAGLDLD